MEGLLLVGEQGLPGTGRRHLVNVFVDTFQCTELQEKLDGGLLPEAGHAGNVIRWVTFDGLEVRVYGGHQATEPLSHRRFIVYLLLLDAVVEQHPHEGRHQLKGVGVSGKDNRLHFLLLRLSG